MRSDTRISKRSVDAFKSDGARAILWDNELRGFGLVAMSSGAKSYIVNYRKNGRYHRLTLGQHGRLTPDEARRLAKKHLGEIADGADPVAERKKEQARKGTTFAAVAEEFIRRHVSKTRSAHETGRAIRTYLLPRFGQLQITDIRRRDVAELLDDIEGGVFKTADGTVLGGPVMADRVLAHLRKLMNWYATREDDFTSPIVRGMSRTQPRLRARKRTLDDGEIRALWGGLNQLEKNAEPGSADAVYAPLVRTLLLTAQRKEEVAGMRRSELKGTVWTIPHDRHKTGADGTPKQVPLSSRALRILNSLPCHPECDLIFTTNQKTSFAGFSKAKLKLDALMISELRRSAGERCDSRALMAIETLARAREAGLKGDKRALAEFRSAWWTLHDLRRTAKTLMVRAGVRPDITERVLGHVISGVEGTYDRHDYVAEKRGALERLDTVVQKLVNSNAPNVVRFPTANARPDPAFAQTIA